MRVGSRTHVGSTSPEEPLSPVYEQDSAPSKRDSSRTDPLRSGLFIRRARLSICQIKLKSPRAEAV